MQRAPRHIQPDQLTELTNVTFQNRFLTRPSVELNDIVLGVVGLAQSKYQMPICGMVMMSTHYHQLVVPESAEHMADFMEFVNGNLSKEIGRLHGWSGKLWHDRYHHIPVSDEEAAQVSRLRYLLAAGVKEFLVDRVAEWPGVHCAQALIEGTPLAGTWYNRSREYAARQLRGKKDVDPARFGTEQEIVLSPLPCWAHLPEATWRGHVADLVAEIDAEGARARQREGKKSLGVKKILRVRPSRRPAEVKKSPRPRYHAASKIEFERWRKAFAEIVKAYREASLLLRDGDLCADFPEGTFPCALPFVPFSGSVIERARGQPS